MAEQKQTTVITQKLNARQQKALEVLLVGGSDQQAADAAGVARTTVTQWRADRTPFALALGAAKRELLRQKLSRQMSIYHQHGPGNENNEKYLSPDGHSENVYHPDGTPVTDPANEGTYNVSPPTSLLGGLGHAVVDVLPYWIWGNRANDPTPFGQRFWP